MVAFFYRGDLYRTRHGAFECCRKFSWGNWRWTPVKGFLARKMRRMEWLWQTEKPNDTAR